MKAQLEFKFWTSTGGEWFKETHEVTRDNWKDVCNTYYNKNKPLSEQYIRKWEVAGEEDVLMFPECSVLNKRTDFRHGALLNLCNNYLERLDD